MCGIAGIFDIKSKNEISLDVLEEMTDAIKHRGPDSFSHLIKDNLGFGIRRLSIIDIENGNQPFQNADDTVFLICNGEIYNYKELRRNLIADGCKFKTHCDVEVILHLYIRYGIEFLHKLNGQFAFAIFDKINQTLFIARDHFGICPLFFTVVDHVLIFASEIKSILRHPLVNREVDLTGLDQVFSFPGLVSPNTMFKNIHSLKPGHYILINGSISVKEYWDLNYPQETELAEAKAECYYIEQLEDLLIKSVSYRINADVPVGFYLSGGLDSSLIAALMKKINPSEKYKSFSITFSNVQNKSMDERKYQQMMVQHVQSLHNEIDFGWGDVEKNLREAVFYAESPLKETYNTCSLALSRAVQNNKLKVILSGEGSDELFGGYVGYRLDSIRETNQGNKDLEMLLEDQVREKLWGDKNFFYEKNYREFSQLKNILYSGKVQTTITDFDCLTKLQIKKDCLYNRHVFNKRSYLDFKLRLGDHLIADHCDRVCYANSVEGRYPFLDIDVVEFIKTVPPSMKLKGMTEKYMLKKMAKKYIPEIIIEREKFGFVAPGSVELMKNKIEWVEDFLSYDRIKRQGYFDADAVERLKMLYRKPAFRLNLPYESDLLIVIITFNLFLDIFEMPDY